MAKAEKAEKAEKKRDTRMRFRTALSQPCLIASARDNVKTFELLLDVHYYSKLSSRMRAITRFSVTPNLSTPSHSNRVCHVNIQESKACSIQFPKRHF